MTRKLKPETDLRKYTLQSVVTGNELQTISKHCSGRSISDHLRKSALLCAGADTAKICELFTESELIDIKVAVMAALKYEVD